MPFLSCSRNLACTGLGVDAFVLPSKLQVQGLSFRRTKQGCTCLCKDFGPAIAAGGDTR